LRYPRQFKHRAPGVSGKARVDAREKQPMSRAARLMAGLILILIPTVEFGGQFLLRSLTNPASHYMDNALREDLFRAGHAHAGALLILALVGQVLADAAALPAAAVWAIRIALPLSPILISAGFFLSAPAVDGTHASGMVALTYAGGALLAVAVLGLAVGLLRKPAMI
jgi:hypothetical protein